MVKDKALWIFIGLIVFIAAACGVLAILCRDQLVFDPASVINDGVDFVLGLLSMIISFWIAEIYWKNKTEREQTARTVDQLIYYLGHVAEVVAEIRDAVAKMPRAGSEAARLEQDVLANLRRLSDGNRNVLRIIDVSSLELKRNERVARASSFFRSAVAPALEKLAQRAYVRPGREKFESALASVGDDVDTVVRWLKGEFDELNPPGRSN